MSEKILFVDDDPNLLASCERTLRRHFQIETADGGEAGLAKLASRGPYAVVVADRQMPRMDGIEFLGAVRKRAPDTSLQSLTDFEMELRMSDADGQWRWFHVRSRLRRQPDGQVLWDGVVADITERKAAEEKIRQLNVELEQRVIERTAQLETTNAELRHSRAELRSLFESLPGLYLILTPDLKIVDASDAYLKATLTTREGILGRQLFDVFPDNPNEPGTKAVANMQASIDRLIQNAASDTMAIARHDVRGPDGVFVEWHWSSINSPMFGADRQIKYIVHRVEEVTEYVRQKSRSANDTAEFRARTEQMEAEIYQSSQKVQAANEQLLAANKELEAFSYSVSHDLRAPLRAVDGFALILANDHAARLDPERLRLLQVIRREAARMGRLIDDLLAFSRMGRREMRFAEIDMTVLATTVFKECAAQVGDRKVRLTMASLLPTRGDSAMIRQVLANLLSNAIKYSRPREVAEIELGSRLEGNECIYWVKDNGVGFDPRYTGKLFGVFQRLHSDEEFEGTGVGLALVQRIIHRHGGRIWAEGKLNEGASFYFTLPNAKQSS
jgi:signal transduction histidine kinase